jgi:hypothetical protein
VVASALKLWSKLIIVCAMLTMMTMMMMNQVRIF